MLLMGVAMLGKGDAAHLGLEDGSFPKHACESLASPTPVATRHALHLLAVQILNFNLKMTSNTNQKTLED